MIRRLLGIGQVSKDEHAHRWGAWTGPWEHIVTYAHGCETYLSERRTCICGAAEDRPWQ